MTAPVAIVIGLGVVYDQYADFPPVRRAFVALSAAAAAYLLATAWKIAAPLRGRPLAIARGGLHVRGDRLAAPAVAGGAAGAGDWLHVAAVAVPGMSTLAELALVYAQLSLLAFGGANAVIPEMQRQVVDVHHWMTRAGVRGLYALAQAAPGPNMMVVSLVGWRVAGFWGALVTTGAVAAPSSILTLLVSGMWFRFKDADWRKALQAGLQPVTAGLIMASAALLIESTRWTGLRRRSRSWRRGLFLFTKLHPMLILGGAASAGAIGLGGIAVRTGT